MDFSYYNNNNSLFLLNNDNSYKNNINNNNNINKKPVIVNFKMPKLAKNLLSKMAISNNKENKDKTQLLLPALNESCHNDSKLNAIINEDKKSNTSSFGGSGGGGGGDDITTNSSNADDLDLSLNDKINNNENEENNDAEKLSLNNKAKSTDSRDEMDSSSPSKSISTDQTKSTIKQQQQQQKKNKINKTDIEIVDDKINKCKYEIQIHKQKLQNEWSKHMNKHMSNFYVNSNKQQLELQDNNNTKPLLVESHQIEKNIKLLNKKLQTYEKRREKLFKQQEKLSDQESASSSNCSNNLTQQQQQQQQNDNSIQQSTTVQQPTIGINTSTTTTSNVNDGNKSKSLNRGNTINGQGVGGGGGGGGLLTSRSQSNEDLLNSSLAAATSKYQQQQLQGLNSLNIQNQQSTGRFIHNYSTAAMLSNIGNSGGGNQSSDDQTSTNQQQQQNVQFQLNDYDEQQQHMILNRNQLQRDYPILLQYEQDFFYLKQQQSRLQSDLEDLQKKMTENRDMIIKEIKENYNQVCEPVRNIAINLLKSNDQKLDEFKNSMKTQIQSLDYKLVRNYQEVKEDISAIKSRIDSIEKNKATQANSSEAGGDYYQLFTKLFDIILTLCAIFLLVLNNTATFIKYTFSSSPRCILFIFALYLILYNYFKLDHLSFISKYFEQWIINQNNTLNNNNNTIYGTSGGNNTKMNAISLFFNRINQYIKMFLINIYEWFNAGG